MLAIYGRFYTVFQQHDEGACPDCLKGQLYNGTLHARCIEQIV